MTLHMAELSLPGQFANLLYRTIGLDPGSLGESAIERAVESAAAQWRAAVGRDGTLAEYWCAVVDSPALLHALIETVVVPETWFFRDAGALEALAWLAAECLRTPRRVGPLRILSLPCSTGEEPYSIVMALLDAGIAPERIRVDAMDISTRTLAVARRAFYGRNSFRGKDLAYRDRYFACEEAGWRLASQVTQAVRFSQANVMALDPSMQQTYDFVFCRNVLIYFDRAAQAAALNGIAQLLVPRGTLFVGPAEAGLATRHGLQSARMPMAFAFRRPEPVHADDATAALALSTAPALPAPRLAAQLLPLRLPTMRAQAMSDPGARSSPWSTPPAAALSAGAPMPFRVFPVEEPAYRARPADVVPAAPGASDLAAARALADAGRLDEALAALHALIERDGPDANVFHLLGVLADATGDAAGARGHYRKALYIDPKHAGALTQYAALLALDGDHEQARRMMQRAERARDASGAERD